MTTEAEVPSVTETAPTATAVAAITANIFERASRRKLLILTSNGHASVEDLWDMPLTTRGGGAFRFSLDEVTKRLSRELRERESEPESFVLKTRRKSAVEEDLQLSFDVVKLAEAEEARTAAEKREKKQRLLGLIAEKQDDKLKGATEEELAAMVEAL